MIILTYVDDCIIVGNSMKDINSFLRSLMKGPETLVLTDEEDIDKFLGIEITRLDNDRSKVSQPFITGRIVSFLGLMKTNSKASPVSKPLLCKDLVGKFCKEP